MLIGIFYSQIVESSSLVSVLFREAISHPYISFFHLLVNGFSVIYIYLYRDSRLNRPESVSLASPRSPTIIHICTYLCIHIHTNKLSHLCVHINVHTNKLEKWFPLQGERAHSLKKLYVCTLGFKKEKEEETEQ